MREVRQDAESLHAGVHRQALGEMCKEPSPGVSARVGGQTVEEGGERIGEEAEDDNGIA